VIGLENQRMASLETIFNKSSDFTGIRAISQGAFTITDRETDWINRVMRHGKGVQTQLVDNKCITDSEFPGQRQGTHCGCNGPMGCLIGIDRDTASPGNHTNTFDMITVLMGYDQGRKHIRGKSQPGKALDNFLSGKTIINEQAGILGLHQRTVSPAAAAQNRKFHCLLPGIII
jgi:hypothetical protein